MMPPAADRTFFFVLLFRVFHRKKKLKSSRNLQAVFFLQPLFKKGGITFAAYRMNKHDNLSADKLFKRRQKANTMLSSSQSFRGLCPWFKNEVKYTNAYRLALFSMPP